MMMQGAGPKYHARGRLVQGLGPSVVCVSPRFSHLLRVTDNDDLKEGLGTVRHVFIASSSSSSSSSVCLSACLPV